MAIKNSVSIAFLSTFLDCITIFDCRLSGVIRVSNSLDQNTGLTIINRARVIDQKIKPASHNLCHLISHPLMF